MRIPGTRTLWLLAAAAVFLAVAATGAAIARQAAASDAEAGEADVAARSVDGPAGERISSIQLEGRSAIVTGTATASGADATRTLWYESLAGAAFALDADATSVERRVVDEAGTVLVTETDPVDADGVTAFSQPVRSAEDIASDVQARASALGATVIETNYVPFLGGTAELVIRPRDPVAFMTTAGTNVAVLLGGLGQDHGSYLVTIVDSKGAPLLILGYTAGFGGGSGQGIGWQAPGVNSDAIHGRSDEGTGFLP